METTAGRAPRLPALDGLRFYAIGAVILLHLTGLALVPLDGDLGIVVWGLFGGVIDVFLIATGFVLFLPIASRGGEIADRRSWWVARAARIFPSYWLCLLLLLASIELSRPGFPLEPGLVPRPSLEEIPINFAALQMPARLFDAQMIPGFSLDGPLWLISILAGFYLTLPLVARGFARRPLLGLGIALAITLAWKLSVVHLTGLFEWLQGGGTSEETVEIVAIDQLPGWAFSFALGMTGAWAYLRLHAAGIPRERVERTAVRVGAVALVAVLICAYLYGKRAADLSGPSGGSSARLDPFLGVAYSLSRAGLMAAIALGPLWMQRPFANRAVSVLSERNYGVYLIHLPIAFWVGRFWLDLPTDGTLGAYLVWVAVVIPLAALYAEVTLRLVERPAAAWARRRVPARRPAEGRPPVTRTVPRPDHASP